DIEFSHGSVAVAGVIVYKDTWSADEVIVCAGAWSNALLPPLGINMQVSYQKAQIMHLQHEEGRAYTAHWPVVMPPTDQYLLAFADGRIVIGATDENDVVAYDSSVIGRWSC